jgi:putative sigma-54 modulation protein
MEPIQEAEAIERMELSGYDQYLFKNKNTGKISMIYRRNYGGYGLVEPE